jgi:hypothetical protein
MMAMAKARLLFHLKGGPMIEEEKAAASIEEEEPAAEETPGAKCDGTIEAKWDVKPRQGQANTGKFKWNLHIKKRCMTEPKAAYKVTYQIAVYNQPPDDDGAGIPAHQGTIQPVTNATQIINSWSQPVSITHPALGSGKTIWVTVVAKCIGDQTTGSGCGWKDETILAYTVP